MTKYYFISYTSGGILSNNKAKEAVSARHPMLWIVKEREKHGPLSHITLVSWQEISLVMFRKFSVRSGELHLKSE